MNPTIKIQNDKRSLLNDLINITREVTAKYGGGRKKIVTEDEIEIQNLIECWEKVLKNGLKTSLLSNVQELLSNAINNCSSIPSIQTDCNGSMFWSFASKYLSPDEQKRFNNFKNLWTDKARAKALIRNGLNECCLDRYILTWINADNLSDYFESHALLRDEKAEILVKLSSDINNILFAIKIDIPELNVSSSSKPLSIIEPVIESGSNAVRSSISKPKKVNQIDNFEDTTAIKKKESEIVSAIKTPSISYTEPVNEHSFDRASVSTESSSHSFFDAKDDDDTISSTSSEENEEVIEMPESTVSQVEFEEKMDEKNKIEDTSTIQKQRERIVELEQQILDLTAENTRLRQLLNANKVNTAASFQVSIPRAVLRKAKTKTNYYVYEINLRATNGSDIWTVFKRYRDFYKLHKDLKKQHIQIKILDFPPKKKIGNMDFDFVEDRRQRLQVYIRHVLHNLPELQVETRQLLEAKCAFFK